MTVDACRASQRECSQAVHADLAELRRETKADIAAIREAAQNIDRSVSQVRGYLGLNGNASGASLHEHRRKGDEEITRLHARLDDVMDQLGRRDADPKPAPGDGVTLPRWAVYASAVVLVLIVVLAAAAGERGLVWLLRAHQETTGGLGK